MTIILDNDSKVYRVHSVEIINEVVKQLAGVSKLDAIRFVRHSIEGMDLAMAKSYVEHLTEGSK